MPADSRWDLIRRLKGLILFGREHNIWSYTLQAYYCIKPPVTSNTLAPNIPLSTLFFRKTLGWVHTCNVTAYRNTLSWQCGRDSWPRNVSKFGYTVTLRACSVYCRYLAVASKGWYGYGRSRCGRATFTPVFMCFVFIWEQTATCATYNINWLVFVTEMKSVYSAVRTGSLNKAVCASSLKGLINLLAPEFYI